MAWQWSLDPRAAIEVYRKALAPTLQAQQEGLGVFERLSRYQYAVIGDYLELGLAQAKAGLTARTPAELTVTQAALTSQFTARQQSRLRELVSLATDTQQSMQQLIVDATSRVAEGVKQVI
jgi:hypothetical protein